jgi:hypothetical protein
MTIVANLVKSFEKSEITTPLVAAIAAGARDDNGLWVVL